MTKFRIWGMVDVEIEANTEEEALKEFDECIDDIISSYIDIELIEEE